MNPPLHPNGFLIHLLTTLPFGMRLRLHVWPPGSTRLETPHDHRSWFISLPLWGSFIERRFRLDDSGTERHEKVPRYEVLRCHSTSSNGKPVTTPEGEARLVLLETKTRTRLRPYFCPSHAIHSYAPTTPAAASLVFFGPPKQVPRAYIEKP